MESPERIHPDQELIKAKLPTLSWSWSRWRMYQECPLKLYFYAIVKLPKPFVPVPMQVGAALHDIIKIGIDEAIQERTEQVQDYSIKLHTLLSRLIKKAYLFKQRDLSFMAKCLKNFSENFYLPDKTLDASIFSELPFAYDWNLNGVAWMQNPMFRMKIDYFQVIYNYENDSADVLIIDWKTGKDIVGLDQLRLYASFLLMDLDFQEAKIKLKVFHLSSGDIEFEEFDPELAPKIRRGFIEDIQRINSLDNLDPTPSIEVCRNCDYQNICPHSAIK